MKGHATRAPDQQGWNGETYCKVYIYILRCLAPHSQAFYSIVLLTLSLYRWVEVVAGWSRSGLVKARVPGLLRALPG